MKTLAINGGTKVREELFPRYESMGDEEKDAVLRVMNSGILSKYIGAWDDDFMGGEEVQSFEAEWSRYYGVKHTIAVNSNSSGIHAALGACYIGLGDEVIVSPYSMSVSASAPLVWNATPVFADIDEKHYCITPESIRKNITKNTKAIIVVHIFGCPADMDEIMKIADEYNLYVIEDCAQAPDSFYKGKRVGSIGHIGIFSLNYHKHIHTGEGGMCTTNDDKLARRLQLIRNHAEAVVENMGETDLINMIGFNFRLTELQAAIGREQLKRLKKEVEIRQDIASQYHNALSKYEFIKSYMFDDRTHSYYVQAFQYDETLTGVPRDVFLNAVKAELSPVQTREKEETPIYGGYTRPLYLLPIFQNKTAYKNNHFPFNDNSKYDKGTCSLCEEMYYKKLWFHDLTRSPMTSDDVADVINAYVKVCDNIDELK